MATRSTTSIHSLMASGGDTIPKEYHRKVLKKIAQLTKVIYALNTQNEQHDEFVAKLRSLHEAELQRILLDSTARLERCEESYSRERETQARRIDELEASVEEVKGERDQLHTAQVSYRKEVEEKLKSLRSEHVSKVQSLTRALEKFKSDQAKQLSEVSQLKDSFAKTSSEQMKELRQQHEKEVREAKEQSNKRAEKLKAELNSQAALHTSELEKMKQGYEAQVASMKENMSSAQRATLTEERKKWEELVKRLQEGHSEKEEQLKSQVAMLTKDLRVAKDKLALAEQKVKDLAASCEENIADSSGLQARLQASLAEVGTLKSSMASLNNELDIAREQYRQQSKEMKHMSLKLGKSEALLVSNEGVIENLRSQIAGLQQKLQELESEQETLINTHHSSSEQHNSRLRSLERELDKLKREKQELHAQFAREIEAAHAQLSERETELGAEHLSVLQKLRDKHDKALAKAVSDREAALEELKKTLDSQYDEERWKLSETHLAEISKLKAVLTDKTAELDVATEELKRLKSAVTKSEQGLGSATEQVETLRSQIGHLQRELSTTKTQLEGGKGENDKLKATLESLRRQLKEKEKSHLEEMKRAKDELTQQLEEKWKERLKRESGSLREELSQRHSEDSKLALSELANLKDGAMEKARQEWVEERARLLRKIEKLSKELRDMQDASAASLEEAKITSNVQISLLRQELNDREAEHTKMAEELKLSHQEEVLSQMHQHEKERGELLEKLKSQHNSEMVNLQEANKLAVASLRETLELQKETALREEAERHREESAALQSELASRHQAELSGVRDEHRNELERHRQQLHETLELRRKETTNYEVALDDLQSKVEGRDSELSKLRDKLNSLTVSASNLRKELEFKGHEALMIRREANNRLHLRERELSSVHHAEIDSLQQQYRQKSNLLLADFNQAKALLNARIQEMERQISEWQRRYHARDSKPEDLEMIKELKIIVREQEQKMREFIAEKRFYQLELMNREKNYNKLFSAKPLVVVLDPLQTHKKKHVSDVGGVRYSSAPSLVSPLPSESTMMPSTFNFPDDPLPPGPPPPSPRPHHLAPLTSVSFSTSEGASISSVGSSVSGVHTSTLTKKEPARHSQPELKPRRLVMLQDSALSQKKLGKTGRVGTRPVGNQLQQLEKSISPTKNATLLVQ